MLRLWKVHEKYIHVQHSTGLYVSARLGCQTDHGLVSICPRSPAVKHTKIQPVTIPYLRRRPNQRCSTLRTMYADQNHAACVFDIIISEHLKWKWISSSTRGMRRCLDPVNEYTIPNDSCDDMIQILKPINTCGFTWTCDSLGGNWYPKLVNQNLT